MFKCQVLGFFFFIFTLKPLLFLASVFSYSCQGSQGEAGTPGPKGSKVSMAYMFTLNLESPH